MKNSQKTEDAPKIKFNIYVNSTTEFDFVDRIRILFGKKLICRSTVVVNKEVEIVEPTKTTSYTEDIFPKKQKGYECKIN